MGDIVRIDKSLFLRSFDLTLEEMKLILIAMTKNMNNDFNPCKITIKELKEKTDAIKNKVRVKKMLKKLETKTIDNTYKWISYAKYQKAIIEIMLNPEIKKLLTNDFVEVDLKTVLKLDSIYAIRFYIIAKAYKERVFLVDELHNMFQTSNSYRRDFGAFRKSVLEIVKREIDKKTNLNIDFEYLNRGRKIIKVILKAKEFNNPKIDEILANLKEIELSLKNAIKELENLKKISLSHY